MKIALLGCGRIAETHARLLQKNVSGAEMFFCDRNREKAENLAARFSSLSAAYTDFDALLQNENPSAVHILTQPASHFPLATTALEAGAHAYIEKPVAESLAEFDSLQTLAAGKQRILYPGYSTLGYPVVSRARAIMASGKMGGLVSVHCDFNVAPPAGTIPYGYANHWAYFLDGGILHNVIDHPMSILADALADAELQDVSVLKRADLPQASPNLMHVSIRNEGQIGSFTLSYGNGNASAYVSYFLEAGTLRIDLRNFTVTSEFGSGPKSFPKRITTGLRTAIGLGIDTLGMAASRLGGRSAINPGIGPLIANFYAAIRNEEAPIVSHVTARTTVRLLEGIWAKARRDDPKSIVAE